MATNTPRDILLRLDSIDQLFNEPDVNPFSEEEVHVLGEPALLRAVRRLLARRRGRREREQEPERREHRSAANGRDAQRWARGAGTRLPSML